MYLKKKIKVKAFIKNNRQYMLSVIFCVKQKSRYSKTIPADLRTIYLIKLLLEFVHALLADALALEVEKVFVVAAKNTC